MYECMKNKHIYAGRTTCVVPISASLNNYWLIYVTSYDLQHRLCFKICNFFYWLYSQIVYEGMKNKHIFDSSCCPALSVILIDLCDVARPSMLSVYLKSITFSSSFKMNTFMCKKCFFFYFVSNISQFVIFISRSLEISLCL